MADQTPMTTMRPTMISRVRRFIDYKRALGYTWRTESFLLVSFAKYADRRARRTPITVALAMAWATAPRGTSRVYHAKRLDVVRTFAKHEAAVDLRTEVPPQRVLGPSYSRVVPYIYSRREVATLMRFVGRALVKRGIRHASYTTVIGLLASTGMRISELLALDDADVDLTRGLLHIRKSKNRPLRVLPLAQSTVRELARYKVSRDQGAPAAGVRAFIRESDGTRLKYQNVRWGFRQVLRAAAIGLGRGFPRGPRIHDLRHTFACNHLLRAYREGRDIDAAVHDLSVYLGHATLNATYWYLTAVPQLLREATKRLERVRGGAARGHS